MTDITALIAAQSPLLQLPGELRNKIFGFAVGGHTIVIKNIQSALASFEYRSATNLVVRLVIASDPKLSKDPLASRYYFDTIGPLVPESERVSQIFTIALFCRQIYTESALLQYTKNTFLFNGDFALQSFAEKLNVDQRAAVRTISLDIGYVCHQVLVSGRSFKRAFGIPSPEFRKLLPGLKTIYVAPKHLVFPSAKTMRHVFNRLVFVLELGGKNDLGLEFMCFDVLDATEDVKKAWGVRFTHEIMRLTFSSVFLEISHSYWSVKVQHPRLT